MVATENYGAKVGDGVKGIFKGINDVGEALRTNINGVFDSTGDAVAGRGAHRSSKLSVDSTSTTTSVDDTAHASTSQGTTSMPGATDTTSAGAHPSHTGGHDSEHLRQSMNKGVDDLGAKLDGWMHRHHK